jgi:hypothetical protein
MLIALNPLAQPDKRPAEQEKDGDNQQKDDIHGLPLEAG